MKVAVEKSPTRRLSPWELGSREWDGRMGTAMAQVASWRRTAFFSLGLTGVALVGLVYLGAQPKTVPHIVEIDKIGSVAYRGPVGAAWADFKPSTASLRFHLGRFVENVRSVSFDRAVIKANWVDAYNFLTPAAAATLTTIARENDPFKRARTERVTVEIVSIVPLSEETWQADWKETSWDTSGAQTGQQVWRGTFRIFLEQPRNEESIVRNPLGLFIRDFSFSRLGS